MEAQRSQNPDPFKPERVGHPEKLNQSLGVDVPEWNHPNWMRRQEEKLRRDAPPAERHLDMNEAAENLLALNIDLFGVAALTLGMMVMWSRATRGKWPNRKRVMVLSGVCLFCWILGNISYFYFRSH
jgi:hypothetical protein